jgi:hypothetical protein
MSYQNRRASKSSIRDLVLTNIVTGCACIFNRALRDKALACKDASAVIMHDWWLALAARLFGKLIFLETAEILYRQHGGNRLGASNKKTLKYIKCKAARVKESLSATYRQTDELINTFSDEIPPKTKAFLEGYASLDKSCRLQRLRFYKRHGMSKGNFFETAALYLLG